ncbi:hypothetical protein WA577_004977 [Blastocystis sp. JDR]
MDDIRKLLDHLMGPNRDGERRQGEVDDFRDPRVCKPYLLGFCLHDRLASSKYDIGPCNLIHDPELKKKYEADPHRRSYNYESILYSELQDHVRACDRRISNAVARFKIDGMDNLMKMEEFDDVKDLAADISRMEDQVEELQKMGKDELAEELQEKINTNVEMKASIQAMHVKDEKEKLPPEVNPLNATPAQKTRICNVCGGMLSVYDIDQRIADHFIGKSHIAFLAIRKKLRQLQAMGITRGTRPSYRDYYRDDRRDDRRDSHRDSYRDDRRDSHRDDRRDSHRSRRSDDYHRHSSRDRSRSRSHRSHRH